MISEETGLRQIIERLQRDYHVRLYMDVTPLLDENWTGIPVVTGYLARELIEVTKSEIVFFLDSRRVVREHINDALIRNTGLFLQRDCAHGVAFDGPLHPISSKELSIGIFPSVKSSRRIFDLEFSIVHDISTITTPEFHIEGNIRYHTDALVEDLSSNDITFCISDATLNDVNSYFGADRFKLVRSHNGICWPDDYSVRALSEFDPLNTEPYFLILGTREPRKNIAKVLDLLSIFPDVCQRHRFVIAGKMGWLMENEVVPARLRKALESGQIVFTGFVTEFEKYKLLLGAEASIYPSFLEGFGLPIIESLSVGTPCIASLSSSMPEIGGDACFYFDPFSVTDLYRVVRDVQSLKPKQDPLFRARCIETASRFSWTAACETMLNAIEGVIKDKMSLV